MEDLLRRLAEKKPRCSVCKEGDHYHATYVGPDYAKAKVKILFVGLDAGVDSRSYDVRERQTGILDYYKTHNWNQHYRGCVKVASYILRSDCSIRCASRCTPEKGQECALRLFAQGNAVKCVPADATDMTFRGKERVEECLTLMLDETAALRPDVIVLQGRPLGPGLPTSGPFFKAAEGHGGKVGRLYFAMWPGGSKSIVVSFSHPSRGHLETDWEPEIVPALDEVRKIFHRTAQVPAPGTTNSAGYEELSG